MTPIMENLGKATPRMIIVRPPLWLNNVREQAALRRTALGTIIRIDLSQSFEVVSYTREFGHRLSLAPHLHREEGAEIVAKLPDLSMCDFLEPAGAIMSDSCVEKGVSSSSP